MESPFQPYLDTNYVPSESDRVDIEQLLQGPLQEVHDINAEIEALGQQLGALTAKKEERARFIARHRALLSPIRALPDEILRTIFDHCIPKRNPFPEKNTAQFMSAEEAPMLLTFVCQRWRQIALDYSSLWDKPHISLPLPLQDVDRWNEMARSTASLTQLWLSRAKDQPLNLTVVSSAARFPEAGLKAIYKAIVGCSMRWQVLQLEVANELLDNILRLLAHSVPHLEQLHLQMFFGDTPRMSVLQTGDSLMGGPSITGIHIRGRHFTEKDDVARFAALPLRWSQLTTLMIFTVMLADVEALEIIAKSPALERCGVYISKCQINEPLPQRHRVAAVNLTTLQIGGQSNSTNFILSLNLPKLRKVYLVTRGKGELLTALVQSASGKLQSLVVASNVITTAKLIECLALTAELEVLRLGYLPHPDHICGSFMTDGFLTSLTPPSDPTTYLGPPSSSSSACKDAQDTTVSSEPLFLCPKLRDLSFHVTAGHRISDSAIFQFIKRRRVLQPRVLTNVTVIHDRHDAEMDIVSELKKEGVDLRGMAITLQYRQREGEECSTLTRTF